MRSTVAVAALALSLLMLNAASAGGTLYGVDDDARTLISIDPVSLNVTTIGDLGVADGWYGDLAYDAASGTMYWVAGEGNNSLYTINLNTGAATWVGEHGIDDMYALGFVDDDLGGGLYGQEGGYGDIYHLDKTTGAASYFGNNEIYAGGFDWDPDTMQMIVLEAGSGDIYGIGEDLTGTFLASPGGVSDGDIAYDHDRGIFWAADYDGYLYQYDGDWNQTTMLDSLGPIAALEYVPSGDNGSTIPAPGALLLAGTGLLGLLRFRRKLAA